MARDQSLSYLLKNQWDSFEEQFWRARQTASPKNVHALRVSTRRLEAILLLATDLKSLPKSEKILSTLKKARKSVGPLRDIQVGEMALKELHYKERNKGQAFRSYLLRNELAEKKKARRRLKQISLGKRRKTLSRLEKSIHDLDTKMEREKIEQRLDKSIRTNIVKLNRTVSSRASMQLEQIHSFRILAKQCRYQCECLKSLTGKSILNLSELRELQSVTGKIQNSKTLIESLDRFLKNKKNRQNLEAVALRKNVCELQARLLKSRTICN